MRTVVMAGAEGPSISEPGTYVVVLRSTASKRIRIGKWGWLETKRGYYLYVGSAFGPGGVFSRVSRHCRTGKTKRWHVDYLREYTRLEVVWYALGKTRAEHDWAEALESEMVTEPVKGFGCSDCRCFSHLFFVADDSGLTRCSKAIPAKIGHWRCSAAN